jgi:hypothetical protein
MSPRLVVCLGINNPQDVVYRLYLYKGAFLLYHVVSSYGLIKSFEQIVSIVIAALRISLTSTVHPVVAAYSQAQEVLGALTVIDDVEVYVLNAASFDEAMLYETAFASPTVSYEEYIIDNIVGRLEYTLLIFPADHGTRYVGGDTTAGNSITVVAVCGSHVAGN